MYVQPVDFTANTAPTTFIGNFSVASLAASRDATQVYVAHSGSPVGGTPIAGTVPAAGIYAVGNSSPLVTGAFWDIALSPDAATIYGTTPSSIRAFDTTSSAVKATIPSTGGQNILGLGVSEDGTQVAATTYNSADPANASIWLLSTAGGLSLTTSISSPGISNGPLPACHSIQDSPMFTGSGRIVDWDYDCQIMFQVDLVSRTPLGAVDPGASRSQFNSHMQNFAFDRVSARAYAAPVGASGTTLVVIDPFTGAACIRGGFSGTPLFVVGPPAGGVLYVTVWPSSGGTAFVVDKFDTGTGVITRGVHTFGAAHQLPRAMRVVTMP